MLFSPGTNTDERSVVWCGCYSEGERNLNPIILMGGPQN